MTASRILKPCSISTGRAEAITNVLDNAVKYTPSGGVVELKIAEYPSYLRLDISDNGIGIPEEEQAKIFGRFYRGKQSAGIDGVGIGLYLTRDIVSKQCGYIKVKSDKSGSTFFDFFQKVRRFRRRTDGLVRAEKKFVIEKDS